mmetsp:Transcript_54241/g.123389  ORF Transcript_54241/g.123389 Transcript_54241/m.123389 type:complete len:152 (-) Transcript_54241:85-540(-)
MAHDGLGARGLTMRTPAPGLGEATLGPREPGGALVRNGERVTVRSTGVVASEDSPPLMSLGVCRTGISGAAGGGTPGEREGRGNGGLGTGADLTPRGNICDTGADGTGDGERDAGWEHAAALTAHAAPWRGELSRWCTTAPGDPERRGLSA